MRPLVIAAGVLVSLACFSPTVHAEPVVITGGVGNVGTDISGFDMTGTGTSISLTVLGSFAPTEFFPGDVVSFTATVMPEDFSTFGFPVILNGTDYGNVFLRGRLTFVTDTFIAPPLSGGAQTFAVPGALSGMLTGFQTNEFSLPPLFAIELTGHGTFSSIFREIGPFEHPDRWFAGIEPLAGITFDAGTSPGATPEPASLLLVATGAAGLFARRRKASSGAPRE